MKLLTLSLFLSFLSKSWFSLPYWSAGKTKQKTKQKQRWHFLEWNNPNRRSRDSRDSSRPLIGRRERFVDANKLAGTLSTNDYGTRVPAVQIGPIHGNRWLLRRHSLDRRFSPFGCGKTRSSPGVSNKKALIISWFFPRRCGPFCYHQKQQTTIENRVFVFGNGNITKKHRCVNWCAVDTTEQSWRPLGPKEKEGNKKRAKKHRDVEIEVGDGSMEFRLICIMRRHWATRQPRSFFFVITVRNPGASWETKKYTQQRITKRQNGGPLFHFPFFSSSSSPIFLPACRPFVDTVNDYSI